MKIYGKCPPYNLMVKPVLAVKPISKKYDLFSVRKSLTLISNSNECVLT